MKRILSALLALMFIAAMCTGCAKQEPAPETDAVLPDFETATYAVLVGSTSEQIVDEKFPRATKLPFDSVNDAVLALMSKKADYVVSAYTNCICFMRANPGKLALLPGEWSVEGNAIAVNKEETELLADIDRTIEKFLEDGTMDRILDNWIREDGSDYVREEIPVLEDAPVLRVAVSAEREPMCFVENGEITGVDPELMRRIAYEIGMRVEFEDMKFSAMIPSVLSGKTPVAASNISVTEERRKSVDFSTTYYFNPQVIMTRAELTDGTADAENAGYTSLDQLAGKRIAVGSGSSFDQAALDYWPDAELLYFDTSSDQIIALQQNKVDAFLSDEPVARLIVQNTPGLKIIEEELVRDAYGFAFPKTEAGAGLRDEINQYIASAEGGKLQENLDEIWFGEDESKKVLDAPETLPATNGLIRLASTLDAPPFDYLKDEQPVGYEVDLIMRFCKEKGYGLEIFQLPWASALSGLVSGRYDMAAACMTITEERKDSMYFSEPHYFGGVMAVVLESGGGAEESESFFAGLAESFRRNFIVEDRWKMIVSGVGVTLLLSICSGVFGIIVGFAFCLMNMSRSAVLNKSVTAITRILQGTPMVVLLMIFYYIIFNKSGLDGISVAIIAFGLNFGAYASQIMLSGIRAIDNGQREAAFAIGFKPAQTFTKIVFPQAARHFLPVLKGEYISLVKMTAIVGYVAVQDLTKVSDIIRSRTYEAFFPLIVTAIIYFLLSYGLSSLLKLIEVRVDPKRRPRTLKGVRL